jgi:hypothetical protein
MCESRQQARTGAVDDIVGSRHEAATGEATVDWEGLRVVNAVVNFKVRKLTKAPLVSYSYNV